MVQFEMSFIDKGGLDKVTGVGLLILETITIKSFIETTPAMGISTANFRSNKFQKMAYDVKVLEWKHQSNVLYNSFFHLRLVFLPFRFSPNTLHWLRLK